MHVRVVSAHRTLSDLATGFKLNVDRYDFQSITELGLGLGRACCMQAQPPLFSLSFCSNTGARTENGLALRETPDIFRTSHLQLSVLSVLTVTINNMAPRVPKVFNAL